MGTDTFDPHFVRHVAGLADKHEVVAHTAVFSRNGIKLIERGHRIDSGFYDKLVAHKLMPALEDCLIVSDAVNAAALAQAVEDMLEREPAFANLTAGAVDRHHLAGIFATLPLSDALSFKLTVAREERPEVFHHSLQVAYCAATLAYQSHLSNRDIVNAAAAGLFHDLGLLHVDPELFGSAKPLGEAERHYLYAHPLTAYLMLERDPLWHPVVSKAVLEHHERIDGSGYPKGLAGDRLSSLGQLLAVAELAATLLATPDRTFSRLRLGIVLRMNEDKLNHEYYARLLAIYPPDAHAQTHDHRLGDVLEVQVDLAIAFLRWKALAQRLPDLPLTVFLGRRMERLGHSLAAAGLDLEYWTAMDADIEFDAGSLSEMKISATEGVWQLNAIAQEARRRWATLAPGSAAALEEVTAWLDSVDAIRCP